MRYEAKIPTQEMTRIVTVARACDRKSPTFERCAAGFGLLQWFAALWGGLRC